MIALTEVIVLELLRDEPNYTAELTRRTPLSDSAIKSAAYRLEKRGSLTREDVRSRVGHKGGDRGFYTITEKGRSELKEWRDTVLSIFDRSNT